MRILIFILLFLGTRGQAYASVRDFEDGNFLKNPIIETDYRFPSFFQLPSLKLPNKNVFERTLTDPYKPEYGAGRKAVITSLIVPGLGLYQTNRNLFAFGWTLYCYGAVGAGIGLWMHHKSQGEEKYLLYQQSKNQTEMESFLFQSNEHLSKVPTWQAVFATGVAAWIFQAYMTLRFGKYNELYKKRTSTVWQEGLMNTSGFYDSQTRTFSLSTKFHLKRKRR